MRWKLIICSVPHADASIVQGAGNFARHLVALGRKKSERAKRCWWEIQNIWAWLVCVGFLIWSLSWGQLKYLLESNRERGGDSSHTSVGDKRNITNLQSLHNSIARSKQNKFQIETEMEECVCVLGEGGRGGCLVLECVHEEEVLCLRRQIGIRLYLNTSLFVNLSIHKSAKLARPVPYHIYQNGGCSLILISYCSLNKWSSLSSNKHTLVFDDFYAMERLWALSCECKKIYGGFYVVVGWHIWKCRQELSSDPVLKKQLPLSSMAVIHQKVHVILASVWFLPYLPAMPMPPILWQPSPPSDDTSYGSHQCGWQQCNKTTALPLDAITVINDH